MAVTESGVGRVNIPRGGGRIPLKGMLSSALRWELSQFTQNINHQYYDSSNARARSSSGPRVTLMVAFPG
jgi:hypothetical protein